MIAGRDFNDLDRKDSEPVMIVSQSVAQRMFPGREALDRQRHTDGSDYEVYRHEADADADCRHRGGH